MEQGDQDPALPVRVAISIEHKKIEDMREALAEGKAGVAEEINKKISKICEFDVTEHYVTVFNNGVMKAPNIK